VGPTTSLRRHPNHGHSDRVARRHHCANCRGNVLCGGSCPQRAERAQHVASRATRSTSPDSTSRERCSTPPARVLPRWPRQPRAPVCKAPSRSTECLGAQRRAASRRIPTETRSRAPFRSSDPTWAGTGGWSHPPAHVSRSGAFSGAAQLSGDRGGGSPGLLASPARPEPD
jgi:hypothetical protein